MKRDLKPFVVEVKRGTRRSSFLGAVDQSSTMTAAQRRAEAALFAPTMDEVVAKPLRAEASRRILQSLVEPKPVLDVAVEDMVPPEQERRPRPVGRPRKVKPPMPVSPREDALSDEIMAPPKAVTIAPPAAPTPTTAVAKASEPLVLQQPASSPGGRSRLRDRSAILARYVLGTEPAPGERWSRSSRRPDRRSRNAAG